MRKKRFGRTAATTAVIALAAVLWVATPSGIQATSADCGFGGGPICATSQGCVKFFCWNMAFYYDMSSIEPAGGG